MRFKEATRGDQNRVKRGNVVKLKGKAKPQMVVVANWKKGIRTTEFDGPIKTHRRDTRVPSDYGDWVATHEITHVAVR